MVVGVAVAREVRETQFFGLEEDRVSGGRRHGEAIVGFLRTIGGENQLRMQVVVGWGPMDLGRDRPVADAGLYFSPSGRPDRRSRTVSSGWDGVVRSFKANGGSHVDVTLSSFRVEGRRGRFQSRGTQKMASVVDQIRQLLENAADAYDAAYENDDKERASDELMSEIRHWIADDIFEVIEAAAGKDGRLRSFIPELVAALSDVPGAVDYAIKLLDSEGANERDFLLQVIGQSRWSQAAAKLNDVIRNDPDLNCRLAAIQAAGQLRDPINLPTLLALKAEEIDNCRIYLIDAIRAYGQPECKARLTQFFDDPATRRSDRVLAAWGLARLGEARAVDFLEEMVFVTAESFRAAQALCDVRGWPFEWDLGAVKAIQKRVADDRQRR